MASPAHCFYCFECLSASFAGTEPPKLSVVEELWEEFEASKLLTLQSYDEELEDENEAEDGSRFALREASGHEDRTKSPVSIEQSKSNPGTLSIPIIGRLQEPSVSSESSNSSTHSALSTSSSRSVLTSATSVASPSSTEALSLSSSTRVLNGSRFIKSSYGATYPLFVTWNTVSKSGRKSLRGCIGTFEAQELAEGLKTYALTSAFGDTRFSPIPAHLLPSLSCSLTLLSSFETCSHALDWELGTHGIRISFTHRGRRYGATYLPDVPVEQGWTKEETVESLMRKAGWDGYCGGIGRRFMRSSTSTAQNRPWEEVSDFKTIRYQGFKASASYAEWQEWRKWVESSTAGQAMLE
ncbi:hypothetical protein VTO42DRAFT_940 [Malbranchea cinnamomea]